MLPLGPGFLDGYTEFQSLFKDPKHSTGPFSQLDTKHGLHPLLPAIPHFDPTQGIQFHVARVIDYYNQEIIKKVAPKDRRHIFYAELIDDISFIPFKDFIQNLIQKRYLIGEEFESIYLEKRTNPFQKEKYSSSITAHDFYHLSGYLAHPDYMITLHTYLPFLRLHKYDDDNDKNAIFYLLEDILIVDTQGVKSSSLFSDFGKDLTVEYFVQHYQNMAEISIIKKARQFIKEREDLILPLGAIARDPRSYASNVTAFYYTFFRKIESKMLDSSLDILSLRELLASLTALIYQTKDLTITDWVDYLLTPNRAKKEHKLYAVFCNLEKTPYPLSEYLFLCPK